MRDGGGLAGAGAGQDRDRAAEREGGFALGIVQPGEDAVQVAHERTLHRASALLFGASADNGSVITLRDELEQG